MSQWLHETASRVILVVILATFLSPTLGWEMIAGHELAHSDTNDADHNHDRDPKSHDHKNPHSFMGHLLTHMPMGFSSAPQIDAAPSVIADLPDPLYSEEYNFPEPPFHPPYATVPA